MRLHVKHHELDLTIHEIFGGFNVGAVKRIYYLSKRAEKYDTTVYTSWTATKFVPHYAQLISSAIVTGDARRCLDVINHIKTNGLESWRRRRKEKSRP